MTPSARVAAAITILDRVLLGEPAEKIVTNWGRSNRYAGSGDRAAIRDLVFQALRCKRSYGYLGGGEDGRALMIGWMVAAGDDHNTLFTGEKYAPEKLNEAEAEARDLSAASRGERLDCPDWLLDYVDAGLVSDADKVLKLMQSRASVFLRVNTGKSNRDDAAALLVEDGIETRKHELASTALEVTLNPRRVAQGKAFREGFVELQDAASQAVVEFLPLKDGNRVLDYCAGGGGKSLAIAASGNINVTAYDIDNKRMNDLPARALRAETEIQIAAIEDLNGQKFDLVLCDAPCTGSGAWRRSPDAKWALTPERLEDLCKMQAGILEDAKEFVSSTGILAYATCSIFRQENQNQIADFLQRHQDWRLIEEKQFSLLDGADGFFVALLQRV